MIKEIEKKTMNLITLFCIFFPFHGIAFNCFCCAASPSIQYSILRNTISIKMVCGQAHPQKILPNTTVNKITNTMNVSIPIPKIKKSCGQKIIPNMMNFRSRILSINNGSPFTFINGSVKKTTR